VERHAKKKSGKVIWREMVDPADLFSSEGGFTKNVFFLHYPSLLHLHPVERSGIFVAIFHVLLIHQSCVMNKAREMLIRIQQ
jgi:hypothetical protein